MGMRRRNAVFVANLVVFDEPHVFLMKSGKANVVALAIPEDILEGYDHVAVTVSERNWERYLDGFVDLLYLFTYPFQRRLFKFSSLGWKENTIMMDSVEGDLPPAALPSHGLFSRCHAEDFHHEKRPNGQEKLYIDGEWQLDEFGKFYQKYSDIYTITAVLENYSDASINQAYKGRSISALRKKPYQGGSSYLHMFGELEGCLPREQRLGLDGIIYNSPGDVRIWGDANKLSHVEKIVSNFANERARIQDAHKDLRDYLSEHKLLALPAASFLKEDPMSDSIRVRTDKLVETISLSGYESLRLICEEHELVIAKVVLAIYRRVEAAAAFFAEGRMAFERID